MTRPAPLVLVHGDPENAAVWGPLLGELQRDDVITLSPPGFGVPGAQVLRRDGGGLPGVAHRAPGGVP